MAKRTPPRRSSRGIPNKRPNQNRNQKPKGNSAVGGAQNASPQPQTPQSTFSASSEWGNKAGRLVGGLPAGLIEGSLGSSMGIGEGIGTAIASPFRPILGSAPEQILGGAGKLAGLYYGGKYTLSGLGTLGELISPYVKKGIERANETPEQKQTRVHREDEVKWRKKATEAVMGTMSTFEKQDLDSSHAGQDAVWRESLQSMDKKAYTDTVVKAIKADNPSAILDMVGRQARSKGKKPNTSKPLYLPNVFKDKEGKEYAYAIDASEKDDSGKIKARFIKIPIGGRPFEEEK